MDYNFPDVVLRPGGGRRCRVLYSYSPQNDDELELQVNDEIDFLSEVEDGWWRGRLGNRIGVFPSNFVCELNNEESCPSEGEVSAPLSSPDSGTNLPDDAPVLPPKPVKETCRVLFAYDAVNDDELTLKKDDVITIITKEVGDKGWWKGELRGKVGLFPDNFVEVIAPPEESLVNQQKKPDRPSKTFDKTDGKMPLISGPGFQKIGGDESQGKDQETKVELSQNRKNSNHNSANNLQSSEKGKQGGDSSQAGKFLEKNLFKMKMETPAAVGGHKKTVEVKSVVNKKPVLPPPPITNKPKPAAGKPSHVKRLSEEINDLMENSGNKSPANVLKRLSGDVHDLIDGAISSKLGCLGGFKEDMDLDIVERSDMLTHITSSRPRPPGRRLPTKEAKETEGGGAMTNGNGETGNVEKEKGQKEREWEKNKPPWVNELKLNLRSSKTSPSDSKKLTSNAGQVKGGVGSPGEPPSSSAITESTSANVLVKQFSPQPPATSSSSNSSSSGFRIPGAFETGSKVLELSSKFSSGDKCKPMGAVVNSSKNSELVWNSVGTVDHSPVGEDFVQIPKNEYADLKSRVEKLEKVVMKLASQLHEEAEKRKLVEKELNKLTDLVTQV